MLKDKLGENKVMELAFADYLKYLAAKYYGFSGDKQKDRGILQKIGTEIARNNNPDIWVNVINEVIWAFRTEYEYFIVSDCRFENEITVLQDLYNTISVKVERPNFDNGLTEEQKTHPSENALKDWEFDYLIVNDGTLDNLGKEVDKLIKFMEG
jgi:hypothetical protein